MSKLLKFAGTVLLSSLLAVSAVFATFHQLVWRYQPYETQTIRDSVVLLKGLMGSCSAVYITPTRLLTAAHCQVAIDLHLDGKPVKVLKIDPESDLMLIETEVVGKPIPFGVHPEDGSPVVLGGWPVGITEVLKDGTAAGLLMETDVPTYLYKDLIVNIVIEGGYSGGGVFQFQDGQWTLVGIISAGSRTLALASTISQIMEFLKSE